LDYTVPIVRNLYGKLRLDSISIRRQTLTEAVIRPIQRHELPALLDLYRQLHATDAPLPAEKILEQTWNEILNDPKLYYFVAEVAGQLMGSCTLAIIPNLTRGARPYGVIENVVTHANYRRQGIGTQLLRHALQTAWSQQCYKVMLLTGSKQEATLHFYEQAGFQRGVKTGFVALAPEPNASPPTDTHL
jgi:ribosomal protein S18 acetylase RimI-like enzyme